MLHFEWNTCLYLSLTLFKCNVPKCMPDFIILLCQTPDDFTCNRECWLIGLIRQSAMHPVDPDVPYFIISLCPTQGFTCQGKMHQCFKAVVTTNSAIK